MFAGSTIGIHTGRSSTSSRVDVRAGGAATRSGLDPEILAHGMIAINSAGPITQTAVRKKGRRPPPPPPREVHCSLR